MSSVGKVINKTIDFTTLVGGSLVTTGAVWFTYKAITEKTGAKPIIAGIVTALVGMAAFRYSWMSLNDEKIDITTITKETKSSFVNSECLLQSKSTVNLPDGVYDGVMTKFVVVVKYKGYNVSFTTQNALDCANCPVEVVVRNRTACVTAKM